MKKQLILIGLIIICTACSAPRDTRPAAGRAEGGIFAKIDSAVANVAGNTPKLIELHKKTDAASSEYWNVAIAHTIPEQPAAVVRLMAKADIRIERMCPREVIEDELSFVEYVQWMEKAVAALDTFTLDNPGEEIIRKACLQAIRDSLATRDKWRY